MHMKSFVLRISNTLALVAMLLRHHHRHRRVMDLVVMDHRHDLHRLVVLQEDRRPRRQVHPDRVDNQFASDKMTMMYSFQNQVDQIHYEHISSNQSH